VACKRSATSIARFGIKIPVMFHRILQRRSYRQSTKRLHYALTNNAYILPTITNVTEANPRLMPLLSYCLPFVSKSNDVYKTTKKNTFHFFFHQIVHHYVELTAAGNTKYVLQQIILPLLLEITPPSSVVARGLAVLLHCRNGYRPNPRYLILCGM